MPSRREDLHCLTVLDRLADELRQLIVLLLREVINAPCDLECTIEGRTVTNRALAP
ncbi:MAG TPA: hypothetical protein VH080_05645 [Gemmatimonadaceae bacterium]|nr:hypothetical protein [Gemmatimonadaceae bacterium]